MFVFRVCIETAKVELAVSAEVICVCILVRDADRVAILLAIEPLVRSVVKPEAPSYAVFKLATALVNATKSVSLVIVFKAARSVNKVSQIPESLKPIVSKSDCNEELEPTRL